MKILKVILKIIANAIYFQQEQEKIDLFHLR